MGSLTSLIIKQKSEFMSLREVCLDFLTTLNEDIIRVIAPKQNDLLKSMGKFLEKEPSNFAKSSRARETLQFETIMAEDLQAYNIST